jgi:hypothetical protein
VTKLTETDISVGTATAADRILWVQFLTGFSNFLFATASRPGPKPTQSPTQLVQEVLSPRVKWPGCETDHPPPTSFEVNNGGSIPTLYHAFSCRGASLINHRHSFIFIYLSMALQPFVRPWPLFQFLDPMHSR